MPLLIFWEMVKVTGLGFSRMLGLANLLSLKSIIFPIYFLVQRSVIKIDQDISKLNGNPMLILDQKIKVTRFYRFVSG